MKKGIFEYSLILITFTVSGCIATSTEIFRSNALEIQIDRAGCNIKGGKLINHSDQVVGGGMSLLGLDKNGNTLEQIYFYCDSALPGRTSNCSTGESFHAHRSGLACANITTIKITR